MAMVSPPAGIQATVTTASVLGAQSSAPTASLLSICRSKAWDTSFRKLLNGMAGSARLDTGKSRMLGSAVLMGFSLNINLSAF